MGCAVIVYRYGCLPPADGAAIVDEQIRLGHRYRNALTEVELSRRALLPPRCPCAVVSGRCACVTCSAPAGADGRVGHCGVTDAAWALARGLAISYANAAASATVRRLRAACGLYWGTYLLCEQAMDAQRRCLDPPRFRRWDGSGRIGVQIQHGLAVSDLLGCGDTRLRLEPILDDGRPHSRRHDPERGVGRTRVWLRVGSDGRASVWAVFPVFVHRPLPADGLIKWAVVTRVRVGTVWRYALHLTVEQPRGVQDAVARSAPRSGTVAVDLGWRRRDDGWRAGYWCDDAEQHGELLVPATLGDKMDHARSIASIRARAFDSFRERLADDLATARAAPAWLADATATLRQWRSADRLYALYWRWRRNRVAGDETLFAAIDAWARSDRHLHDWTDHEADKVIASRKDLVRNWAAGLARRYARVIVEDVDLRQLIARRTDSDQAKAASPNRHLVAPGALRLALKHACARHGAEYAEIRCAWTTIDCYACGHRVPWDAAPEVDHKCSACGSSWDQDYNACRNLLASSEVASGGSAPIAAEKASGNGKIGQRRGRLRARGGASATRRSQVGGQDGEMPAESA